MEKQTDKELEEEIRKEAYNYLYGYWDNEYLDEHNLTIKKSIMATANIAVKKMKGMIKIEDVEKTIDEFTKKKYQIHNVDECDCCEKNLNNFQELKQSIKKLGEKKE